MRGSNTKESILLLGTKILNHFSGLFHGAINIIPATIGLAILRPEVSVKIMTSLNKSTGIYCSIHVDFILILIFNIFPSSLIIIGLCRKAKLTRH